MRCLLLFASFAACLLPVQAQKPATRAAAPKFENGLPDDPQFFPLAVWLQSPHNAARYAELGINLYVGLYEGPTEAQLDALDAAGMRTICACNEVGRKHDKPTIVGWMHGDEPDNAQARDIPGYGPPILPKQVVDDYARIRRADPTRPVLLNLGQGVAWDNWYGRGERTNHPEDYPEYAKGCDIVSFDIYPVTHDHVEVKGRLEFVGRGVQRLVEWTGGRKPVWACIETGHVGNASARPTAEQVRAEVWIAIACGARGIVYFAHEFAPKFVEDGLLQHQEIAAAVKDVDAEVLASAAVLNGPIVADAVRVATKPDGEIAVRAHLDGHTLHLFTASLSATPTRATFTVRDGKRTGTVTESRAKQTLKLVDGRFADDFAGYAVHHYRIER